MLGQVRDREASLAAAAESARARAEQLRLEAERLRSAPSPLAAATAARDECARDKEKFEAALENMAGAKATCARKAEERKAELASRKQQLADVLEDNERLRHTVQHQALSRSDVNRCVRARARASCCLFCLRPVAGGGVLFAAAARCRWDEESWRP